jgi:hypothetical protein
MPQQSPSQLIRNALIARLIAARLAAAATEGNPVICVCVP